MQKKKKKGQYKDKDSDMMSAFVDKPENKVKVEYTEDLIKSLFLHW